MSEYKILYKSDSIDEKGVDFHKNKQKRTILIATSLLVVMGIIMIFLFFNSKNKQIYDENSIRNLQESSNFIKATYDCPNDDICRFCDKEYIIYISSFVIDGVIFPPENYYQEYKEAGKKVVIINFKEKIINMGSFFNECYYLRDVDLRNFDSSEMIEMSALFKGHSNLKSVTFGSNFDTSKVTKMDHVFQSCESLTSINLNMFNTSSVTDFECMFSGCRSITKLDLKTFDVSNAVNFGGMFELCNSLTSIDLSSFRTDKAVYMNYMFYGCNLLENIDLSNFNTGNVITMSAMFAGCLKIKSLDLSSFDTSNLVDADRMFYDCQGLVDIKQHFTSEKLKKMRRMFADCIKLEKIDLSGIVGEELVDMRLAFSYCSMLYSIDLRNFAGKKCDTTDVFKELSKAGNFVYDSSKLDSSILNSLPTAWVLFDVKG